MADALIQRVAVRALAPGPGSTGGGAGRVAGGSQLQKMMLLMVRCWQCVRCTVLLLSSFCLYMYNVCTCMYLLCVLCGQLFMYIQFIVYAQCTVYAVYTMYSVCCIQYVLHYFR